MKTYKLKDILAIKTGKAPKNKKQGNIPVYSSGGIISFTDDYIVKSTSILLPRVGTLDSIFYVNSKTWVTDNMYHSKIFNNEIDPKYLYYYLKSIDFSSKHSKTSQPKMTINDYYDITLLIPDKSIQTKIRILLDVIESKIEVNNKINDNLEKQMKLIYKYWFDDFNFIDKSKKPYKANGGAMIWNEELKKEIPKGWTIKTLSELLVKNKDKFDFSSILPTIDLSVMVPNKMTISQHNWSSEFSSNLFKMEQGDILFGSIRPYLHKAGFAPFDGVVAGTVHSFKPINNNYYNFSLITICRDVFFDYAVQMSYGTRMPVVNDVALLNYKIPYNEDVIKDFNKINILKIMSKLINENIKLINLKNQLLPLLMNGQVTIED
ncbi:restriction endonuclease subunit S [Mycoplasmopsis bovis]|uniref:restriction endonuclease subunit S n=1 Tax=Mycoplasmopsis bovis TaxID=28903 RepID=UPI003D28E4E0